MEPKKRLGAEQRIRRQSTFKNLVEKGTFARGEFFYLWVVKRRESGRAAEKMKPSIGIAVSRKTEPRAVGRNIWKRRVKEIFREKQSLLCREAACLIKVRTTSKKPSFREMEEDLVKLFKKAGAWA